AIQRVRVARQSAVRVRVPMPAWLGLATAAAVLLALSAGVYLYVLAAQADKALTSRPEIPEQHAKASIPPGISPAEKPLPVPAGAATARVPAKSEPKQFAFRTGHAPAKNASPMSESLDTDPASPVRG